MDFFIQAFSIGFLLSVMVGPIFFLLLETSITKGFRAALTFDFGVVFGDFVFILIAYFSTNQILERLKDDPSLFVFGGVVMFLFGMISYIKQKKEYQKICDEELQEIEIPKNNYIGLFFKGFFLNVINIGILGFWMMVIITQGPRLQMIPSRVFTFFTATLIFYLAIDVVKIILAKQLKHRLTPVNIYKIKRVISFILIIFGVFFLLQGVFPGFKEKVVDKIEETR